MGQQVMCPYCHVALHEESGLVHGSVVKTDPNADLSGYYKVASGPKQTPYIITGTMMGSSQKSAGKRSRIYLNLKEEKESDEVCCPDAETMLSFVEEDDWFDESVKPIANEYVLGLFNAGEKECQRDMKAWHGPEQIIGIEIATCDCLRIAAEVGKVRLATSCGKNLAETVKSNLELTRSFTLRPRPDLEVTEPKSRSS
ncbi:hypothetical protein Y032_0265g662 [Ancylostoma ceylanicum]|uniref:Uncharacterized protein n=1 Tax=Ancylostoma ceylanicum TaxID=53326 RepID=A0A016SAL2_9BILA|nr:hypothetical protein Y032_0265g662 [Ancylostoma ceylanicum]